MIYIGFIVSLCINIVALFYVRWLLVSVQTMNEQMDSIWNSVGVYMSHLKGVYELETFYGDETLLALIDHGNRLMEEVDNFDRLIDIEETDELDTEEEASQTHEE